MVENLYTEKLNWFKQNEKPEVVLLLAENPDLVKIVITWTSLKTKYTDKLSELLGDSESEVWEWLWENTTYSLKELKDKIGTSLSENALENKMKPLIGNRIIYPDGTLNSFVERYLREQVVKLFEAKSKRPVSKY
ncbi:MAG: hypothetical protein PVJ08_09600 [Dehalococcoidia bacterium]|jgi:hypothetical protein